MSVSLAAFGTYSKKMSIKIPATMPLWMEYVNGTTVIVRNAGIAVRRLSQSMLQHGAIMKAPMRTKGTAVATCGTARSSGVMNAEKTKSTETTKADKPVFAPSIIPALLSFAMMTGLVPRRAPAMVLMPALAKMVLLLGTAPSSNSCAIPNKPYCTPAMSNKDTNSNTSVPQTMGISLPPPGAHAEKSKQKAASNLGNESTPLGGGARPRIQAQMAIPQIPRRSAPCMCCPTRSAEMAHIPPRDRYRCTLELMLPSVTRVSGEPTTRPITWKPISAWKSPIATVIAFLR
mmetsp:Transcript_111142/g.313600  ORF Transcript_111142/g.313600 Transcript_111142/m.313600 type:complete len:289 (+) Transcript_111142:332-1198(+)